MKRVQEGGGGHQPARTPPAPAAWSRDKSSDRTGKEKRTCRRGERPGWRHGGTPGALLQHKAAGGGTLGAQGHVGHACSARTGGTLRARVHGGMGPTARHLTHTCSPGSCCTRGRKNSACRSIVSKKSFMTTKWNMGSGRARPDSLPRTWYGMLRPSMGENTPSSNASTPNQRRKGERVCVNEDQKIKGGREGGREGERERFL